MRHLGSIALAIVFAPLIYLLTGIGEVKFVGGMGGSSADWAALGIGMAALIVAGALYSVMTMARISPLGPVLMALLYFVVELWAVFSLDSLTKLLGTSVFGIQGAAEQPLGGLALFMAIPLIVTIVSPRRWRSKEKVVVVAPATYPAQTYPNQQYAQPAYPNQSYAQPTYPAPGSAAPIYQTAEATAPMQMTPDTAVDAAEPSAPAPGEEPTAQHPTGQ